MRIPALVLGLILPLVLAFSAALVIQAGIQMDSVNDLRTKDYFKTSAFSNDFYTKISTILNGISAREILDQADENTYIDLGELFTEILFPSKTPPVLPTPLTILKNGACRA